MRPLEPQVKTFSALARFLGSQDMIANTPISGVTSNSLEVNPGDLFLALPGSRFHGAEFIDMAYLRGAVAVITDLEGAGINHMLLPTLVIANPRLRAGDISSWVYEFAFKSLFSVGVTGTNGKTTTTSLLNQLWNLEGRTTGLIGTIGIEIAGDHLPTNFTTPEASEVQSTVAAMRERHVSHMAMEVSSHALHQSRISGSHFNISAFTNLTQDHLDYHETMANYFAAKSKLFTNEYSDKGVINIDDPYGLQLVENAEIPMVTTSRSNRSSNWHFIECEPILHGYQIAIRGVGGVLIESRLPLVGDHNLDNALMAIAIAVESGLDPISIQSNLSKLVGVPGRLESVNLGQTFQAIVDFAHTPDAVIRTLNTLKSTTRGRLIAVLGCGGDRDKAKRPIMGQALVELSDVAIFTSDNPRTEVPGEILSQMTQGLNLRPDDIVEEDRRKAISYAISLASADDVVVVLGKGHEQGQEIEGVKYPFDDRKELALAIEKLK